ncbi:Bis(5'-adenosyl)-triphosphatase [Citrus sinensis]|uniref:Bis(5'-adenosyl)-triphosphatase n=1 Tax=Citrus sinensis TaxID=2711 RepID=A0ACB8HYD3_CITSI|nr:Bis(5'-adenosyl)-triphosphatase [Citrus sinensis]
MSIEYYQFGPHKIDARDVFYTTPLSFVMVNLRPVLPADEICDLWLTARKVGRQLEVYHKASSLTLNIQDGPQAGQSVPHVHIHIVPRKESDFENNDEIYDALDVKEKELKKKLDLDEERKDRSPEERIQEANEYRMNLSLKTSVDSGFIWDVRVDPHLEVLSYKDFEEAAGF